MKYYYNGNLNDKKLDKKTRQACRSWYNQRYRCNTKTSKQFRLYGAMGVRVEYSLREFVGWWLHNLKNRKSWTRPTCGRIDHAGNYCFSNIEMQEASENGRESRIRNGQPQLHKKLRAKPIVVLKDGKFFAKYSSAYSASKDLGVTALAIGNQCKRRLRGEPEKRKHSGYSFVYDEAAA